MAQVSFPVPPGRGLAPLNPPSPGARMSARESPAGAASHRETNMTGTRIATVGSLAFLAALTLASCASLHGNPKPLMAECHSEEDCKVTVSIVDCGTFTCKAHVEPDELNVKGNNARWELSDEALKAGYEFQPVYGIWFKTLAGQRNFECQIDGKRFKCKTKVPPTGERYPYGVQIIGGPKSVRLLDPWIVN